MSEHSIQQKIETIEAMLAQEKEEDLRQYRLKMGGTSVVERRENGVCWYPVRLEKTRFDSGERLLIKLARMPEHEHGHLFQSGKLVSLFSNAPNRDQTEDEITGVVNTVRDNEMIVTLNADAIPEWLNEKYLGIQLLFDENSFKEMQKALDILKNSPDEHIRKFRNIVFSDQQPQFEFVKPVALPQLNHSQNHAVDKILAANDIAIVHGPPGTGKTTTIVAAMLQILQTEHQVLVTAPSNAAVDLLVEKLQQKAVRVVRIGHPARVTDETLTATLDAQVARHESYKDLKAIKRQADEYNKLARKYKRNFGKQEYEQRQLLKKEAKELKEQAKQLEYYIANDIIDKAQVIATTLVGAANRAIAGKKFKTVFIDEASQALEPASWIPILRAQRVVLAGDHQQLPPTVKNEKLLKQGFNVTLLEKIIGKWTVHQMLDTQYRMNQLIMQFPSEIFYENKLMAHPTVQFHTVFANDQPIVYIDTVGADFNENQHAETLSTFNTEEADFLIKHLALYLSEVDELGQSRNIANIGIISPYKAQVRQLKKFLDNNKDIPDFYKAMITVNTVDSFQGQERDLVYISMVRSNKKAKIGFLNDTRRMNVAMTRARKKLVVIGDSSTIVCNNFYKKFVDFTETNGAYHSVFEFLYN